MRQGTSPFRRNRLRALVFGCGYSALLTPAVVHSLSLEEISVRSRLGQPLEAVIPVSGTAAEALDEACFSVAGADDGFPAIPGARVEVDRARGQLVVRSSSSVREPLSEITIRVRCRGLPGLDRRFLVAVDLPDPRAESVFARADERRRTVADAIPTARSSRAAAAGARAGGSAPTRAPVEEATARATHALAGPPPAPPRTKPRTTAAPAVEIEPIDVSGLPARLEYREPAAPPVPAPLPATVVEQAAPASHAPEAPPTHFADGANVVAELAGDATSAGAHDTGGESSSAAEAEPAQAQSSPSRSWIHWTLGALLAALLLAVIGAAVARRRRRIAELERAQSMRRASGLEHAIRLDHGIIVKEHVAGTSLTVEGSTQEVATIRPQQPAHTATAEIASLPPQSTARGDAALLDFGTDASADLAFEIESIGELDLEFPEAAATSHPGEVPTLAVSAPTSREPLADSRQYAVDTDLMELAYRDDLADTPDPDATVRVGMTEATLKLETPDTLDTGETRRPAGSGSPDADTVIAEHAGASKVVALWDRVDEEEITPTIDTRTRASRKG